MQSMTISRPTRTTSVLKFLSFSAVGIFIFFVSVPFGGKTAVPLIHIINSIKSMIGERNLLSLVMFLCVSLAVTSTIGRFSGNKEHAIARYHANDSMFSYFTYVTGAIFSVMILFNIGPSFIIDPIVGKSSVKVAADVVASVSIAGVLVVFLVEYGCLEFLGKLIEPIMRTVFMLPGKAAVDALSSFVASPAVGVMITNSLYKKNIYTAREACSITTNFSFCSLGAFVYLTAIAGCADYYTEAVLSAFVVGLILAVVTMRIPPLSRKTDVFYDGTVQTPEERKPEKYHKGTLREAWQAGVEKAESTDLNVFWTTFKSAALFAQKIAAFVVSLSVICLVIAHYTPVVGFLGKPIAPILTLLGIPAADIIAPSTIVGFFALSLPATLLMNTGVPAMAAFYIVVLSTAQIIFFTESANAMLDSEIPVNFFDLLTIFLLRTVLLIPLVALITHIVF